MSDITEVVAAVKEEYFSALSKFDAFGNSHEGYAVLLEEVDELWDDIKANRDPYNEAVHVAAMALRFLVDCC